MAKVVLENISKNFGTVPAVKNFNLTVEDKVELAVDLDKMHLFEKNPPHLRIKGER